MLDVLKWFVYIKQNGYIECLGLLPAGYDVQLLVPTKVMPDYLMSSSNLIEFVDAQGNFHMVEVYKYYKDEAKEEGSFCLLCGDEWVTFMSSFKDLGPKFIHFEQTDIKSFSVNLYTKDGDEIDYRFTKDHCMKCIVVGCHDPNMYQPIPHTMLLTLKRNRVSKSVPIEFNGVVYHIRVTFSFCSRLKKDVCVAFTGSEWEKLCEHQMFSASSAFVLSWGHGGGFVGKVLHGCFSNTNLVEKMSSDPGGCSNGVVFCGKSFITVFGVCAETKEYMSIPASFHEHKISGVYRNVWLNAGGRSLYMCVKIHIDKRVKTCKNKTVLLEGEMHRLKDVLKLDVGDKLRFELVCGKLDSHEALFFDVCKFV